MIEDEPPLPPTLQESELTRCLSLKGGQPEESAGRDARATFGLDEATQPHQDVVLEASEPPNVVNTGIWLAAIVILYLFFAVAYNMVTPAASIDQHNPDENDHVRYVKVLATGRLPVFTVASSGSEFHQPPLYYLLCTPVYLLTQSLGDAAATHCMRFVSTVLGLFLILAAYRCGRRLLPDEPMVAVLVTGLVGLLPMNVAMNASVGNDSLINLLVATGLAVMARIAMSANDGTRGRLPVILGIILGSIVLTKSSGLVLFPAVVAAYALLGFRKAVPWNSVARGAVVSMGLGVLIGAPWLIRNTVLYGDPLGQKLFMSSFYGTAQAVAVMHLLNDSAAAYLGLVSKWTFASFWGVFDQMQVFWGRSVFANFPKFAEPLPWIYNLLAVLCGMALVGLFAFFRNRKLKPEQGSILWAFALLIAVTAYSFTMFELTFFQAQGRYWFTALIPLAIFFALGFRGLVPRPAWFQSVSALLIVGLVVLNAYTVFGLLIPRFQP